MGLIGGMARTAVVAGTATAVSNRVSRRQAGRWAAQDAYQPEQYEQPAYAAPAPPPPPPPGPPGPNDLIDNLRRLGDLRDQGVLTEEEFAAQKARLLNG